MQKSDHVEKRVKCRGSLYTLDKKSRSSFQSFLIVWYSHNMVQQTFLFFRQGVRLPQGTRPIRWNGTLMEVQSRDTIWLRKWVGLTCSCYQWITWIETNCDSSNKVSDTTLFHRSATVFHKECTERTKKRGKTFLTWCACALIRNIVSANISSELYKISTLNTAINKYIFMHKDGHRSHEFLVT